MSERAKQEIENLDLVGDLQSEIVQLNEGLFTARRTADKAIKDYVLEEIQNYSLYRDLNNVLVSLDEDIVVEGEEGAVSVQKLLQECRIALFAAVGNFREKQVLREQCERLKELASKDKLTGLWNQNSFREYVDNVFQNREDMENFSFVFSDIDHF